MDLLKDLNLKKISYCKTHSPESLDKIIHKRKYVLLGGKFALIKTPNIIKLQTINPFLNNIL